MALTVNYAAFAARIVELGSVHFALDQLPAPLSEFRAGIRRACKERGVRVLTSAQHGQFLAWDPDHVVSDERLRAAVEAAAKSLPESSRVLPADRPRNEPGA